MLDGNRLTVAKARPRIGHWIVPALTGAADLFKIITEVKPTAVAAHILAFVPRSPPLSPVLISSAQNRLFGLVWIQLR